jgi:Fic family protein
MPVISSRPAYDWINRVNRKKTELDGIDLNAGQQQSLRELARQDFVICTLRLEGLAVTDKQISRLAGLTEDETELSLAERSGYVMFSGLTLVEAAADSQGRGPSLTPELLIELDVIINRGPKPGGDSAAPVSTPGGKPRPAASSILEVACYWWTADSFLELHPIEQTALAHLRLMDLTPFPDLNERISLLGSSLFVIRAGLPPLTIATEGHSRYKAALEEGRRMNTQPMVEIVAEMTERSLQRMITAPKREG